jgi:hypothetical protein
VRTLLVAAALAGVACDAAAPQPGSPTSTAAAAAAGCAPTIARMVPPQVVMDIIFGGMSPRPSSTPSREAWAASGNWVGNDALWISLPPDGVHQRRYSKLWMIPLRGGDIAISGRQLDGDRSGTFVGSASSGNIGSSVSFSSAGCWELTYSLDGSRLTFTLAVTD